MPDPRFLLYLDFDGVTHPLPGRVPSSLEEIRRLRPNGSGPYFCRENVLQVNRLIHKLDARVVITSSWRLDFGWRPFRSLFLGRVIGQTPSIGFHSRYDEVRLHIEQNGWHEAPWLALDDNPRLYPAGAPAHITDGARGLTAVEVDGLLARYLPGP